MGHAAEDELPPALEFFRRDVRRARRAERLDGADGAIHPILVLLAGRRVKALAAVERGAEVEDGGLELGLVEGIGDGVSDGMSEGCGDGAGEGSTEGMMDGASKVSVDGV